VDLTPDIELLVGGIADVSVKTVAGQTGNERWPSRKAHGCDRIIERVES
jgi:hypothetical protein